MPSLFNMNTSEILEPQDWGFPVPISYGPGRISEIGKNCGELNIKKPFLQLQLPDAQKKHFWVGQRGFQDNHIKEPLMIQKMLQGKFQIQFYKLVKLK